MATAPHLICPVFGATTDFLEDNGVDREEPEHRFRHHEGGELGTCRELHRR